MQENKHTLRTIKNKTLLWQRPLLLRELREVIRKQELCLQVLRMEKEGKHTNLKKTNIRNGGKAPKGKLTQAGQSSSQLGKK